MCDEYQSGARAGIKLKQQIDNALAGARIEISGRLIGKQHRRLPCKGACNGDPLLLTPRQRGGVMPEPVLQSDLPKKTLSDAARLINARQLQRQHDVLFCGQRGK